MSRKLLTADEFRASAKDGARPETGVVHVSFEEAKAVGDEASRKLRFIFSDGSIDRAGDTINPDGWDLSGFQKNPVALWAHDSFAPPIGRASNVGPSSGKLIGDIEFMPPEISEFADSVYRMVKGGYLRGVSVGFMPKKWAFVNEQDRPFGIDFMEQSLLEISLCALPCNENALVQASAAGIDVKFIRDWAEKLLDGGPKVLIPRDVLEEAFRQAKTPRATRQKYLAKAEPSDWKVGAARDLPLDESEAWDGPAACKRMLDDAGFDGETPDAAKAARGFLIYDAANPTLRSSYKLPFADIVDGELKATKGGILAVASNQPPSETSTSARADITGFRRSYENRFSEVRRPPVKTTSAEKSGRVISSANEAKLHEAMGHHESATKCIKAVLDSITPVDDPETPDDITPPPVQELSAEERRALRQAEAKALKASVKAA